MVVVYISVSPYRINVTNGVSFHIAGAGDNRMLIIKNEHDDTVATFVDWVGVEKEESELD